MLNNEERENLHHLLSQYFDNVQFNVTKIIDAQAYVRNTSNLFYVVYQRERPTDLQVKNLFKQIDNLPNVNNIFKHTIVIVAVHNNSYEFAIMSYNEFDRCYLNKNLKWRRFDDANDVDWLNEQLKIQRNYIGLLPQNMLRVKKTIFLNSENINDGEIIYFRTLSEKYKMRSHQELSERERFIRALNGTPEEEFPNDWLDDVIYKKISEKYNNAKVKSDLFLFTTDLANIRIKKDKLITSIPLCFLTVSYNELGIPIIDEDRKCSLLLELLCYPNIFGNNNIIPIDQVVLIENVIPNIKDIVENTYQPLSTLNV